mmetsp:Transcript_22013/g.61235  ORF Transcript_22013/g.61235 Transcript_22013/m.61235 type:complete len:244 (+) Transcript_22013:348-1079(+)
MDGRNPVCSSNDSSNDSSNGTECHRRIRVLAADVRGGRRELPLHPAPVAITFAVVITIAFAFAGRHMDAPDRIGPGHLFWIRGGDRSAPREPGAPSRHRRWRCQWKRKRKLRRKFHRQRRIPPRRTLHRSGGRPGIVCHHRLAWRDRPGNLPRRRSPIAATLGFLQDPRPPGMSGLHLAVHRQQVRDRSHGECRRDAEGDLRRGESEPARQRDLFFLAGRAWDRPGTLDGALSDQRATPREGH